MSQQQRKTREGRGEQIKKNRGKEEEEREETKSRRFLGLIPPSSPGGWRQKPEAAQPNPSSPIFSSSACFCLLPPSLREHYFLLPPFPSTRNETRFSLFLSHPPPLPLPPFPLFFLAFINMKNMGNGHRRKKATLIQPGKTRRRQTEFFYLFLFFPLQTSTQMSASPLPFYLGINIARIFEKMQGVHYILHTYPRLGREFICGPLLPLFTRS